MTKEKVIEEIESRLPEFTKAIAKAKKTGAMEVVMHQDAFAYDLINDTEMLLLGKAIKYAGIHGVAIRICVTAEDAIKVASE